MMKINKFSFILLIVFLFFQADDFIDYFPPTLPILYNYYSIYFFFFFGRPNLCLVLIFFLLVFSLNYNQTQNYLPCFFFLEYIHVLTLVFPALLLFRLCLHLPCLLILHLIILLNRSYFSLHKWFEAFFFTIFSCCLLFPDAGFVPEQSL